MTLRERAIHELQTRRQRARNALRWQYALDVPNMDTVARLHEDAAILTLAINKLQNKGR